MSGIVVVFAVIHYIALFPFSDFAICKNVVKMEKRPA